MMLKDYSVKVVYKNRQLDFVEEKIFPLPTYCSDVKEQLLRALADIENAFSALQDGKPKTEWSEKTTEQFQKIRHRLLNSANAIERLPNNMCYCGQNINAVKSSEYVAEMLGALIK